MCIAQPLVVCLVLPGNKGPGPEMQQLPGLQDRARKPQKTAIIYAGITCVTGFQLPPSQNISFDGSKKPQKTAKNRRPP